VKAAIYCRVSTAPQEEQGTSLKSQLEACRKKAAQLGCADPVTFKESFSGLTRERPSTGEVERAYQRQTD
jgi:site-specific DNA recombinase